MASIDCLVDTQPMAQSIRSVSNHINGTTAAVVGMKVAVIKAENDAAEHVCSNVNRGFYTLIRSQISQKMAKLQSEVNSHLMQLNMQRKQLLAIRTRMERDYQNISARYFKIFSTINRNLAQRVYELDRPTMDFATKDMDKVSNRTRQLTATVPVSQNESIRQSQRIVASNLKFRGLQVVDSVRRFLEGNCQLNEIIDRILLNEYIDHGSVTIMYPVCVCEGLLDASESRAVTLYTPAAGCLSPQAAAAMKNVVNARCADGWIPSHLPQPVCGEFGALVDRSDMSPRAKNMAMMMFRNACTQTLSPSQP